MNVVPSNIHNYIPHVWQLKTGINSYVAKVSGAVYVYQFFQSYIHIVFSDDLFY